MALSLKEQVQAILNQTHEGTDLKPVDYVVVVRSIDTPPTDNDISKIGAIYQEVMSGLYVPFKDWFWGVQDLERRDGKLFWKGTPVAYCQYPNPLAEHDAAHEIARRCKHLEMIGIPVNAMTMDWHWRLFDGIPKEHPYLRLLAHLPEVWERANGENGAVELLFVVQRDETTMAFSWEPATLTRKKLSTGELFENVTSQARSRLGWRSLTGGGADWQLLSRRLAALDVPPDLLA